MYSSSVTVARRVSAAANINNYQSGELSCDHILLYCYDFIFCVTPLMGKKLSRNALST